METKGTERSANEILRQIPSVDEWLGRDALRALEANWGHRGAVEATRRVLELLRARIACGAVKSFSLEQVEREIVEEAKRRAKFTLGAAVNATGVILHTNLGRSPLAREAIGHLVEVATHYSNLEYDLEAGRRGRRDAHTDPLLAELLGAERTLVVNNNAAAVFLTLNSLAEDGEVIVSRGELIEIGGSFRIPDICAKSGAKLREVGTTNRTRLPDYTGAITEHTRALLRVHPSNFCIVGFTERPPLAELVDLAHQRRLPLIEDLGSGCLLDLVPFGVAGEPVVGASLKAGVDVVTFSGDKLLGGPQAGLIIGRAEFLDPIRRNPLFRALRVDKLTIAALEATIRLYLSEEPDKIPGLRMIRLSAEQLKPRAATLATAIAARPGFSAVVEDGESVIGGGSTPGQSLQTKLVAVARRGVSPRELAASLRRNSPPIVARLDSDRLLLDLRTVFEEQDEQIVEAFKRLA